MVLGGASLLILILLIACTPVVQNEFKDFIASIHQNNQSNPSPAHPPKTGPQNFLDVDRHSPHYQAINYLRKKDIVQVDQNGYFHPEALISRAEFVSALVLANGVLPSIKKYSYCFSDVQTQWFAPYVCYGKAKGWVTGFEDGQFQPAWNIYHAESVKILLEALDIRLIDHQEAFWPLKKGQWFNAYALTAKKLNLIVGDKDFDPKQHIKWSIAAEMIYRTLVIKERQAYQYTLALGKAFDKNKPIAEILPLSPTHQPSSRNTLAKRSQNQFKSSAPRQAFQKIFASEKEAIQQIKLDKNFEREFLKTYKFKSTRIKQAVYYTLPGTRYSFLIVNITGRESIHENVPKSVWESFKQAKSLNTFYNEHLKRKYRLRLR